MAVVISAMAPPSLHGPSRLSRASSRASMPPPPPPPPALAKKDALFTEEEFQALISGSGQCELLSFAENHLQSSSSSPLLSIQLQAQLLCREDDAYAGRFQEMPPSFAVDGDVKAPISDVDDIELLPPPPLFCDEEIEEVCAAPKQQAPSTQFSTPRSDDHQAGKKRLPSSPPWPSCIAEDEDGEEELAGPPPPLALPCFPPPTKKARTQTKRRGRTEHGPPPLVLPPPPPTPIKKQAARTKTKSRIRRQHRHAAAIAAQLRKWHNRTATRILTRQFRPPELSRRRTALRCQCPELELELGFGSCALHQDVLPGEREWMYSADQGHGFPPLVGGPGVVLVPHTSAGCGKAMVLQYVRWRHSVSLPTRFYVQQAVEMKGLALQKTDDDDRMMIDA